MMRMNAPSGMPTKVPFLFSNILKRLLKDYQPEYLAIVFDPPGATFRDKIFEKKFGAKANRYLADLRRQAMIEYK